MFFFWLGIFCLIPSFAEKKYIAIQFKEIENRRQDIRLLVVFIFSA